MAMILFDGMFVDGDVSAKPAYGDKTVLSYICEQSKQNGFDRYVLVQNGNITDVPTNVKNVIIDDKSPLAILSAIDDNARNSDPIVVVDASSPFYDADYVKAMIERHLRYMADYTYALGYPVGMTPTVISRKILPNLIQLAKEKNDFTPRRDYLFWALSGDINSFDIETLISPFDLRTMRLSFGQTDAQSSLLTERVFAATEGMTTDQRAEYLSEHPQIAFCGPYMVNWDISGESPVVYDYMFPADRLNGKNLDITLYNKVLSYFANQDNYKITFLFAGLGEPLTHPQIISMITDAVTIGIDCVIETCGTGDIVSNALSKIIELPDNVRAHITIVIKLDAYTQQTYDILHRGGSFSQALENYERLSGSVRTYKLVTRLNENEREIEQYIRNGETESLIIRKYSSYCGSLPDRRVVDLSPFERCPCFHLRREIAIDSDGKVKRCMYNDETVGDLNNNNMEQIIARMQSLYESDASGKRDNKCDACDDYYIFNF